MCFPASCIQTKWFGAGLDCAELCPSECWRKKCGSEGGAARHVSGHNAYGCMLMNGQCMHK
eukprot:4778881-Amphidinium_carterae.2